MDDPQKSYYLNNRLPADITYKNSSFQVYGELPTGCDTPTKRRKAWRLPYRSEVVVPITPIVVIGGGRKKQFLGYLCVDCDSEDAFHDKYDVEMLRGVADGIYDLIKLTYPTN
jgi:hypothetical protein